MTRQINNSTWRPYFRLFVKIFSAEYKINLKFHVNSRLKIFPTFYVIIYVLHTASNFCADFASFQYNLSVSIYCSDRSLPNLPFCLFFSLSVDLPLFPQTPQWLVLPFFFDTVFHAMVDCLFLSLITATSSSDRHILSCTTSSMLVPGDEML